MTSRLIYPLKIMPLKYLVEPEVSEFPYHIDVIREKLSRTLPAILPDVVEELKVAVPEHIPTKDDGGRLLRLILILQASDVEKLGLP